METVEPTLVSAREVCELLHISRSGLDRWLDAGRLTPALKLPGKTGAYLFHRSDIEALKGAAA
ncbi:MAG: helix-turn-helix transcriptional regulator [Actinomycetes bacterium]